MIESKEKRKKEAGKIIHTAASSAASAAIHLRRDTP